jgi:hypothetical protein
VTWVLVDVIIGLLAVGVLIGVGFGLYRHVKALIKTAGRAGERIGSVTAEIDALQDEGARRRVSS